MAKQTPQGVIDNINPFKSEKEMLDLNRWEVNIIGDKKMYIIDNRIHLKSVKEKYEKERDGLKSNTVRLFTTQELKTISENAPSHIRIWNDGTNHYFTRRLTDISYYNKKPFFVSMCIFSW